MSYNHEFPGSVDLSRVCPFQSQHLWNLSHFYGCIPEVICPHNFCLLSVTCKHVGMLQLKVNVYFLNLKICALLSWFVREGNFFFVTEVKLPMLSNVGLERYHRNQMGWMSQSLLFCLFQGPVWFSVRQRKPARGFQACTCNDSFWYFAIAGV